MKKLMSVLGNNRVKSFVWRFAMMAVAVVAGSLAAEINVLAPYISPAAVAVLGLVLGEVSKWLNTVYIPGLKAEFEGN